MIVHEPDTTGRELKISRLIHAPREQVWEVWADARHIRNWWGPDGFTNEFRQMDLQPGGLWEFTMRGPDGRDYPNNCVFRELIPPRLLSFDHLNEPPFSFRVLFEPQGQDTLVSISMVFGHPEIMEQAIREFGAEVGMKQNISRMESYLLGRNSIRELILNRRFDAGPEEVFRAWTDPLELKQWWCPRGFSIPVCEIDPKPGGRIHIDMASPEGQVYPMNGEYLEILFPERLVFRSAALGPEGKPLFEVLNIVSFEAEGTGTRLALKAYVLHALPDSEPYLDGAQEGWSQCLDKLANQLIPGTVTVERIFAAGPEAVWKALTEPDQMKKWYFQIPGFRAEPGFNFRFEGSDGKKTWVHLCEISKVIPLRYLEFSWRYEGYPGNSRVSFELFSENGATRLRLVHRGLSSFPADITGFVPDQFAMGWTQIIGSSLKIYLESLSGDKDSVRSREE